LYQLKEKFTDRRSVGYLRCIHQVNRIQACQSKLNHWNLCQP